MAKSIWRKTELNPPKPTKRASQFPRGARVTCQHPVEAYYSNYAGNPRIVFQPGMVAIVHSVAPKVRIMGEPPVHDKLDEMLIVDFFDAGTNRQYRTSLNFCNVKQIKGHD